MSHEQAGEPRDPLIDALKERILAAERVTLRGLCEDLGVPWEDHGRFLDCLATARQELYYKGWRLLSLGEGSYRRVQAG